MLSSDAICCGDVNARTPTVHCAPLPFMVCVGAAGFS